MIKWARTINHDLCNPPPGISILTFDPLIIAMGKKRKFLSQEEIWDDSALIESWDEALAEYKVRYWYFRDCVSLLMLIAKLYHSIHARGERVQDVLHAAQASDDLITINHPPLAYEVASQPKERPADGPLEDGELEGCGESNVKVDDPEHALHVCFPITTA